MAAAEVGDDVFGEDPTVNRLQRHAADLFGKEDALFVPSGTMGNQICLGALTRPGDEVIVEERAHVLLNEGGAASRWWGVQLSTVRGERGCPRDEDVERVIRSPDVHHPITSVLSLENTHNYAGGAVLPQARVDALAALARGRGLRLHMDGARVFNAAVASGLPVARIARDMDAVSLCLSKGLGAPVGSLVCGSRELVTRARRVRKMLGGGMRQVGVLAAAGIVALDSMVDRLAEDHLNCRRLAEGVSRLPHVRLDLATVQTNIVIFRIEKDGGAADLVTGCLARKVKIHQTGPATIRCVTHKDVDGDDIERALEAFREITAAW